MKRSPKHALLRMVGKIRLLVGRKSWGPDKCLEIFDGKLTAFWKMDSTCQCEKSDLRWNA